MLTKEQERKMVADLVNNTPPGYVKDFLVEAAPLWLDAINSDLCEVGLRELWRQKMEARQEISGLMRDKAHLEAEIRALKNDRDAQRLKAHATADQLRTAIVALQNGVASLTKAV
jgi:hypothetical protein